MIRTRPLYQQGKCVPDFSTLELLLNTDFSLSICNDLLESEFCDLYHQWICSTSLNSIEGLDSFPYTHFSQGTTEAFDKWYIRHSQKRFRIWKGEYVYHKIMFKTGLNWAFLDDEPLQKDDVVIISLPFADSGTAYRYHETLEQCERLQIPTLVDMCWFGTCFGMMFDLTYSCIEEVTFSLSKTFPISRHRIGMRYSKNKYEEDGLEACAKDNYLNYFSQHVGIKFLQTFSSDYIPQKYRNVQIKICEELGVEVSPVVCLAIGDHRWEHLNRGGTHNRLCISDQLHEKYTKSLEI
jgi:hypothetical protein